MTKDAWSRNNIDIDIPNSPTVPLQSTESDWHASDPDPGEESIYIYIFTVIIFIYLVILIINAGVCKKDSETLSANFDFLDRLVPWRDRCFKRLQSRFRPLAICDEPTATRGAVNPGKPR